jgi:opacity protein-like surface antigen
MSITRLAASAAVALVVGWAGSAAAEPPHTRPGLDIGARGAYFKPDRGDGAWSPGALVRIHFGKIWAVEGAADYRQQYAGAGDAYKVETYPVQASLMAYIFPDSPVTPYVLGGVGWYMQRIKGPGIDDTTDRIGPHAGAGLAAYLTNNWSINGDYRFVWIESPSSVDARLDNKRYNDRGHMITGALAYHF